MATMTGGFAALLAPDIRKVFVDDGLERPLEYPSFFNDEPLEWQSAVDREVAMLGTMPTKPEGTQFVLDEPILGSTKTITAVSYGLAFEVTREMWDDDLYGIMLDGGRHLSRSSRNRLEVDAWATINNAWTTHLAFDGLSIFNTAHTRLDGGATQANRPSPEIGFSVTGIQDALVRFEGLVDGRGLPRLMQPVMLLISRTDKFAAREILGSGGKPFTADNEINSLIEEDLRYMVCHYFTSQTQWLLAAAKGVHNAGFFVRQAPEFDSFDDPWTGNAVFTVFQRHVGSIQAWQGLDGSTG